MVVITLVSCPISLRGDLSKWLQEINTGVFVGQINARVRDKIWERIIMLSESGQATMVFNANNEQGMDFRVHNTRWEPIDFDGLKLMLRPCSERTIAKQKPTQLRKGFSSAAKHHIIHKMAGRHHQNTTSVSNMPNSYVVVDIATTGLSVKDHEIIEIAALRVIDGSIEKEFHVLIKPKHDISPEIESLTGISNKDLKNSKNISEVMPEFLSFIGKMCIVCHNSEFDCAFLHAACEQCGLSTFSNHCADTMQIARRNSIEVRNYKLSTLLEYFGIKSGRELRGLDSCLATQQLYTKLIKI